MSLCTKNVLILSSWSFSDALIQTYTLPYLWLIRKYLHGHQKIFLVTSEKGKTRCSIDEINTFNVYNKQAMVSVIPLQYLRFGIRKILSTGLQLIYLVLLIYRNSIDTIHCFGTPSGTIGVILSIITKANLVIDSYEPHAESMLENGTWSKRSSAYMILSFFEKLQTLKAVAFIATTSGMRAYATYRYGVVPQNFYVKPACVDLNKFHFEHETLSLKRELQLEQKITCVYAGKLGGIYLDKEIADFIAAGFALLGNKFRFLLLTSSKTKDFLHYLKSINVASDIVIIRYIPHQEMPVWLNLADFAINPVKPVPSKRYCTSIKDGEYWATGLPVVITKDISDDSQIIAENQIGYVLKDLCEEEYKNAIVAILEQKKKCGALALKYKIRGIAKHYRSYDHSESIYRKIYS
jgi:glycosyltransferase involved in cell wall biosynthesis